MTVPAETIEKMAENVRLRDRERRERVSLRVVEAFREAERFFREFRALDPAIDELRGFRHVFRNIYQGALDIEKLKLVDSRLPDALDAFKSAHRRFAATLRRLIPEVEK
jgi:hypothetical protein